MRVLLVLLSALLLAGCSYGAQPAPPQARPMSPENTAAPPIPQTWLTQVCTSLDPAVAGPPPPATVLADLAGSRDRMVAWLTERARALDTAADGVNAAGPAPVENGQSTTTAVVDTLRQRSSVLEERREALTAIPANDPDALANGLEATRSALVLPGPTVLRDLALPANLTDEARTVPACRRITTPGS